MKKNILLFTFAIGMVFANAQSIEFRMDSLGTSVNGDTITKYGSPSDNDLEQHMWVAQTSGATMDVRAKTYVFDMTTGLYTVCWFVCYSPQAPSVTYFDPTDILEMGSTVANSVRGNFSAHYYPPVGTTPTSALIRYVLYDNNNPTDSSYIDVKFDTNPTSIEDLSAENVKLSAYPNPTSDNLTVKYDVEGSANNIVLNVYDVLGQEIISKDLNGNEGSIKLDLESVNSGVYFYAIKVAGKTIRTERFIVK